MDKTPFAGLTRLDPSDPLSEDGFSFQSENPRILDELLRLAVQTHRHDAHTALPDPTDDPTVDVVDTGGTIPADLSITVGYTLLDADGGETALNTDPQVVTTQGGLETPDAGPDLAPDTAAGTLLAATYSYAVTVIDGLGGETLLGPSSDVTIDPGPADNEIELSGLTQIVTDSGGTGWRVWRSINGDSWGLLSSGAGATDTFMDDGSTPVDCGSSPPTVGVGTTNATNSLEVTVTDPQDAAAVQFRIYASLDGEFASPAVLGTYDIADLDDVKTYTTLSGLGDGAPPDVSRAYPGANPIDYLTQVINRLWLPPVADAASLPTDDPDGSVRVTLDDYAVHTFELGTTTWHDVGGGGGGLSTLALLTDLPGSPSDGEAYIVLEDHTIRVWNDAVGAWQAYYGEIDYMPGATGNIFSSLTTSSLATGASEDVDAPVIGGFVAFGYLNVDIEARVRLYVDGSARTADASRAFGDPIPQGAGVVFDVQDTGGAFVVPFAPCPIWFDNFGDSNLHFAVTNLHGSSIAVSVSWVAQSLS